MHKSFSTISIRNSHEHVYVYLRNILRHDCSFSKKYCYNQFSNTTLDNNRI